MGLFSIKYVNNISQIDSALFPDPGIDQQDGVMSATKLAAVLAVIGVVCLFASAALGATSLADWVLDAAEAFLVLAAVVFEGYVVAGIIADAAQAARIPSA